MIEPHIDEILQRILKLESKYFEKQQGNRKSIGKTLTLNLQILTAIAKPEELQEAVQKINVLGLPELYSLMPEQLALSEPNLYHIWKMYQDPSRIKDGLYYKV